MNTSKTPGNVSTYSISLAQKYWRTGWHLAFAHTSSNDRRSSLFHVFVKMDLIPKPWKHLLPAASRSFCSFTSCWRLQQRVWKLSIECEYRSMIFEKKRKERPASVKSRLRLFVCICTVTFAHKRRCSTWAVPGPKYPTKFHRDISWNWHSFLCPTVGPRGNKQWSQEQGKSASDKVRDTLSKDETTSLRVAIKDIDSMLSIAIFWKCRMPSTFPFTEESLKHELLLFQRFSPENQPKVRHRLRSQLLFFEPPLFASSFDVPEKLGELGENSSLNSLATPSSSQASWKEGKDSEETVYSAEDEQCVNYKYFLRLRHDGLIPVLCRS